MSTCSYSTADPIPSSLMEICASPGRLDARVGFGKSTGGKNPIPIYHGTALSDAVSDQRIIAPWIWWECAYASAELGSALVEAVLAPVPWHSALELLQQWYATPSHQPNEYWDDLKAELAVKRFTVRRGEG